MVKNPKFDILYKQIPGEGNGNPLQYCCLENPWKRSLVGYSSWGHRRVTLLLLSHFSRVRLCATPQTAAHQAPLSLGFSRQEHWSGLPFSSPVHKSESEIAQSCLTPRDAMDCSLPGSSVYGSFLTRDQTLPPCKGSTES